MADQLLLSARNIRNFWLKVDKRGPDECWPWIGARSGDDRPAFGVDGRQYAASHIALALDDRPRPPGPNDHALHGDCSNPACMNPAHLRWGSNLENVADKVRLGRLNHYKGESSPMAKLTEDAVRHIRSTRETGRALAAKYGVSPATICLIRKRRIWQHVA
jgi:hypothetical protein